MVKVKAEEVEAVVTTLGNGGIAEFDEGVIIGFPPEAKYVGRGKAEVDVIPVTINQEKLQEILTKAKFRNVPVLFYGRVQVNP